MTADESLHRFSAATNADGSADAQTVAWLEAKSMGFLASPPTPEHAVRTVESFRQDGRVLTGIHDASATAPGWGADRPVATYATMRKSLNVGGGRVIPAHLVADVTVRPTHRRQGLMRRMVVDDLRQAAESGLPVAALYAGDAGLYGRYGFGPATRTLQVEVDVRRFVFSSPPTGSVAVADPEALCAVVSAIYDQFHQSTIGSVQRLWSHASKVCGLWAEDAPERDPNVRGALHFGDDGVPDGYVTFRFLGWQERPLTVEIVDIVGLSQNAYLALWGFVTSIDLVDVVRLGHTTLDDPLPWSLTDRRAVRVVGEEDGLWLRILDPVACLQQRLHDAIGDPLSLRVTDELGICVGSYRIAPHPAGVQVCRLDPDAPADATLDVSALGSVFLGGFSPTTLQRAGRIACASPAVAPQLDRLFGSSQAPYNGTHF